MRYKYLATRINSFLDLVQKILNVSFHTEMQLMEIIFMRCKKDDMWGLNRTFKYLKIFLLSQF